MKRVRVFCVMVVMVMTMAEMVRADFPAERIREQIFPASPAVAIDDDWIVWYDNRSGHNDIYGYILSEPNEILICGVGGSQVNPSVSGNVVVWQDERNSQMDIRAFDLAGRVPLDLPGMPLNDGINQRNPKISGDYILYEHRFQNTSAQWVYNLYVYDRVSYVSTRVSASEYTQSPAAIDGTIVVWVENRGSGNRVYWRDISAPEPAVQVSESTQAQNFPAVGDNMIVWVEDAGKGDGWDVFGYDTVAGGEPRVVVGSSGDQNRPAISGSIVVYQEKPSGRTDFDIRAVDIDSGATYAIATSSAYNDQFPAVSGRRVIWQRSSSNDGLYMAEIPLPTTIAIDAPVAGQMFLAGMEMEIGWFLVEGDAPASVKIDFSTDSGVSWQPLADGVPFADGYYLWEPIADVNFQTCRVRISDTIPGSSASAMSGVFTIFQCDTALTADLTGDCRVNIADFAAFTAQWLSCGNPYDPEWCREY